ncbi:phenylalanine--tRNA ligase subunit beta [Mycoplasmopsis lipofaciens]|uniref:phenylalanine--tRNA ligase subunit beta n=1 Tax=Mycoplasmopsis lipofaciens TaxID=114884 RepID=UPI0004892BDB|nr:phenylalanine--tRNA ligase subunit beta [Mycoplasmopsis lipofaciens]
MIITLKELNKFLPNKVLDISIEKAINNLGYEVESITPFSDVKGIKFAKVLDVYKNTNSKNLNVVKLLTNTGEITIQTVAQNAKKGCVTVAFVEGAQKGNIVFGSKEMAGINSQGMLSGFSELGFDSSKLPFNKDDLIMLNENIHLNLDPIDYFELNDYIIDITTPANRSDTNSYYVLARELAAYYKTEFKWFETNKTLSPKIKSKIKVKTNEANALSLIEAKLKNTISPLKDMLFLAKHSIEAKNNWAINLTNMTILLTGAPSHVYDSTKIGNKLTCSTFSGDIEILGNKQVKLDKVLAIQDENKVISLACVMGCENSCVTDKTKNVVFEIGCFDNKKIREAAKQIKIDSISSIQGGKKINIEMLILGMKYIQFRLNQEGQLFSQFINLPKSKKGNSILQNRRKLATYANCDLKDLKKFNDVENALKSIGFKFDKNRVIAPNYRQDIENFEDIIEEYFRFYGYSNFKPVETLLSPYKVDYRNINKDLIQSMGYKEVRTFTLTNSENNKLDPFNFNKNIKLKTFVSKEREEIRNSIITSIIEVADYNLKRKINNLNLFEYGMINNNKFVYGLLTNTKNFYQLKQDVLNFLKVENLKFIPFKDNKFIHPNVSAKIYHNETFIGWIGKLHPKYSNLNVLVAEFYDINSTPLKEFQEYDSKQLKYIDLTFELNEKDNIGSKITEIKEIAKIYEINQIDEFQHNNKNNITLRITGENNEIEKINKIFNK